jgi:hypothetical protein
MSHWHLAQTSFKEGEEGLEASNLAYFISAILITKARQLRTFIGTFHLQTSK